MGVCASKPKHSREVPPPTGPEMAEPEAKPTTQVKTENEVPAAAEAAVAKPKEEETEEPAKEAADDNSIKEDKKRYGTSRAIDVNFLTITCHMHWHHLSD
ncbi:hypothetical protein SLEP1_g59346 [Rubroshorea leprosula]|uniref:Uncharacterized protein n=1 Tax=Rubroshorea leprosula TaxID=152421 RepID=A0AAV5MW45_9ROSI|nr:hypothetical protein SLEP1_g59346 [Rubroshorea leprosula]